MIANVGLMLNLDIVNEYLVVFNEYLVFLDEYLAIMEDFVSIKNWSVEERPREKLIKKGLDSLTNAELLAILINTGTKQRSALDISKQLMDMSKNNLLELSKLSLVDLKKVKGVGEKKGVTLLAALELGKRRQLASALEKPRISSSKDSYEILAPLLSSNTHEEFYVLMLNQSNQMVDYFKLSVGGLTGTVVDPRILFRKALETPTAAKLIISHNHPSGSLKPSEADIKLTQKLVDAGRLLDLQLLDHLIIAGAAYYSL